MARTSDLWNALRAFNRRRKQRRILRRPPVDTGLGFRFIGPDGMQSGTFEGDLGKMISALIARSDRFLNVGANVGYYVAVAQSHSVPTIALEPTAMSFSLLQRNMDLNGWGENITALPVAAGEASGFLTIYGEGTGASLIPGWAGNPRAGGQTVPIARLDTIVAPPSEGEKVFVLMDVEGHELPALKGAAALINAAEKPVWMVEVALTYHQPKGVTVNPSVLETLRLFRDAGYAVTGTEHGLRPWTWDELFACAANPPAGYGGDNYIFHAPDLADEIRTAWPGA